MVKLIADAMRKALDALSDDEKLGFAFHWGEAGGVAATDRVTEVRSKKLCNDEQGGNAQA